ncbi:hypothetical protein NBRC116596_02510 [Litorivita sp. NS0012-18]
MNGAGQGAKGPASKSDVMTSFYALPAGETSALEPVRGALRSAGNIAAQAFDSGAAREGGGKQNDTGYRFKRHC